jgi:alkylation response protein AidB-like acyl-CoA dehydrogenase
MKSHFYSDDHEQFRDIVREFVEREVIPNQERWDRDHLIDQAPWTAAAKQGLIGIGVDERYGGGGQPDWRYRCVVMEEFARANATAIGASFGLNEDVVSPYIEDLATAEQKERWLAPMARGELVAAIAMTEPGAGSDLQGVRTSAVRDGDDWILNGSKTFITNGINAQIVIVYARTDPGAGARGFSLLVVEGGMAGFRRGKKLDKIGLQAQDTAELFFDDVRVPDRNLLGTEGRGLHHLMERLPKERMSVAWWALASAEAVLGWTIKYCKERKAFGQRIIDFQNTRFGLAEVTTELEITRAYLETSVLALNAGELSAVDAAKAKWWASELQKRAIDRCLQFFGGYGYMTEYPVAKAFMDARVQTIYGGTTEIMKEIIGRDIATD